MVMEIVMKIVDTFLAKDMDDNEYVVTVYSGKNISPIKGQFIEGLRTYRIQDNRTITPRTGKNGFYVISGTDTEIFRV